MSNYIKTVDFAAKDALASGNPAKVAQGTQVDTEFNNIATAVATKEDTANKGAASGYAPLDGSGLVAKSDLPASTMYEDEANVLGHQLTIGPTTLAAYLKTVAPAGTNKATYQEWYRTNGSTRRGYVGYSTDSNNTLTLVNEEAGASIALTTNGGAVTVDGSNVRDADTVDGEHAAAFHVADNLTSGTIPDARIQASGVTKHQASLALVPTQITTDITTETANFSVASTHAEDFVVCDAAGTITVTVGSNCLGANGRASVFIRRGAGAVTFLASGVTINSPAGGLSITQQHGKAGLIQITSTVFELTGNI